MLRFRTAIILMFAVVSFAGNATSGEAQQFPENMVQGMHWRMIGPFRGGRTRAATGVPSQPNVFYIGAVNGGVWKSNDYGRTWISLFDNQPTQSIGAIAVAPSDPNIIYVASGEGLNRPDLSVGDGVYKSIDGGKTWTHLGLRNSRGIPALAIDPRDPNRVFAAAVGHFYGANEERGIFRSTDGGQTWQKVLYKDENTGGSDVIFDPVNPDVMYASLWEARQGPWEYNNKYEKPGGGLFKSEDGGSSWHQLTNGLPKNVTQIYATVAPSNHDRLYATIATTDPGVYKSGAGLAVYRSDDAGAKWYQVTTDPRPAMRIGGGDLPVPKVDPKNPDIIYSTSIVTLRSTDGGKTWKAIRGGPGGDDYQNIWINPDNPKIILLVSDQGALVTVNGGKTWSSWYNQPTGQMYHVSVSNTFPYQVCGGQQDSGSVCIASRGNDGQITDKDWHPVGAYEYASIAPDPLNLDLIYSADRNEVTKYHVITGQSENVSPLPIKDGFRANRTMPILFSPVDQHILYYAANVLFKTTNGGYTWQTISPDLARPNPGIPANLGDLANDDPKAKTQRGLIYALAPSFKTVNTLWAGTDDGLIWLTRDAGKNWKDITPPEMSAWSKVTQLVASHFDEDTAYASVSRFRVDDLHPYIYRTHDGGKTWRSISAGLPDDSPVNVVREDSERKGLLFAGTENSVWVSFDDGDHWQPLQLNLPHTSMRDLWIHDSDLIVATHGRAFWILDDITPLRQLDDSIAKSDAHLFTPAPAYRIRRNSNVDTPLPTDEPAGENPPDGAIIDYFLAQPASGPVTLEFMDAQGALVRRYSSTDPPDISPEELTKSLFPPVWARTPRILSGTPGMHRWVWDLHYPAPVALEYAMPISAVPHATPMFPLGPHALPGKYTVRLTLNGHSYSAPLTIKMDPRVKSTQEDLAALHQVEQQMASLMSRSSSAILQAKSLHEQLLPLSEKAEGPLRDSLKALDKKISVALDGAGESSPSTQSTLNGVHDTVVELYGEDEKADARPNVAFVKAVESTERDLNAALKPWTEISSQDLPAINRRLRSANLPEIRVGTDSVHP